MIVFIPTYSLNRVAYSTRISARLDFDVLYIFIHHEW